MAEEHYQKAKKHFGELVSHEKNRDEMPKGIAFTARRKKLDDLVFQTKTKVRNALQKHVDEKIGGSATPEYAGVLSKFIIEGTLDDAGKEGFDKAFEKHYNNYAIGKGMLAEAEGLIRQDKADGRHYLRMYLENTLPEDQKQDIEPILEEAIPHVYGGGSLIEVLERLL